MREVRIRASGSWDTCLPTFPISNWGIGRLLWLRAKHAPGQAVWRGDKGGSIGSYEVQGLGGSSGEEFWVPQSRTRMLWEGLIAGCNGCIIRAKSDDG